jgi:transglutaminase-like putative cysteine protease
MNEDFLKEGNQTKITPKIREISNSIEGNDINFIFILLDWVHNNIAYKGGKLPKGIEFNQIFRQRTGIQIIEDGYSSGCSDYVLAFIPLARAKGIPTKYVECINKDYFSGDLQKVAGHVFAECFVKDRWITIDPTAGNLNRGLNYSRYVIYGKGLDSWDLGIRDLKTMGEKFIPFAEEYNKKNKEQ